MNNQQKKLFNIANRIEKLMYEFGKKSFIKNVNYTNITISLQGIRLNHDFIEKLTEITVKYMVNFEIMLNEANGFILRIW
mgnify:CR=1 FL=1